MRYVCSAGVVALSILSCAPLCAQGGLSITNYQFVSQTPATRTLWNVTYRADLVNTGGPLGSVTATLSSLPFGVRSVPGQDVLNFAPVAGNSHTTSSNTFTILVDRTLAFDFGQFVWTFTSTPAGPVANAGPNRTVAIGTTVVLDGSGSTNPSGVGTLSYAWQFTSRPPGSSAILQFSTTVN